MQFVKMGIVKLLTDWAKVVEDTVDLAIKAEQQKTPELSTLTRLPKRFRGRCQPREPKKCPTSSIIKKAWQGHFNPSIDSVSISFKRMVRQLRRITSLKIRIQKLFTYHEIWNRTWSDIHIEWQVILRAEFQKVTFANWIATIPELQPMPEALPTLEWLEDCEQIVRYFVKQQESIEKKLIHDLAKIRHETDVKVGHKVEAFNRIKGKEFPPFH